MVRINQSYCMAAKEYLFSEIERRICEYEASGPAKQLIRMGIGDVTRPLPIAVAEAMAAAAQEMRTGEGFRGYGPEQGYLFLRELIALEEYRARGADISPEEIFISDGAKSDSGSITELFSPEAVLAVCDPVYPAYVDAAVLAGRAGVQQGGSGSWSNICYLPCTVYNEFIPELPERAVDLIYLCFPNNPTGVAASGKELKRWVDYANDCGAVILFDASYEAFISQPGIPHSIYEVDGGETCAIEFRSFSKTAGFTGLRCAYTVVPKGLKRDGTDLWSMWKRRQATRFNGVSYVTQKGAAAVFSQEGKGQVRENLLYYMKNAAQIRREMGQIGLQVFGGVNAPYVWVKTPDEMGSWALFDLLLKQAGVVVTPGAGFGKMGEGYFRISAFGDEGKTVEAMERIKDAVR